MSDMARYLIAAGILVGAVLGAAVAKWPAQVRALPTRALKAASHEDAKAIIGLVAIAVVVGGCIKACDSDARANWPRQSCKREASWIRCGVEWVPVDRITRVRKIENTPYDVRELTIDLNGQDDMKVSVGKQHLKEALALFADATQPK